MTVSCVIAKNYAPIPFPDTLSTVFDVSTDCAHPPDIFPVTFSIPKDKVNSLINDAKTWNVTLQYFNESTKSWYFESFATLDVINNNVYFVATTMHFTPFSFTFEIPGLFNAGAVSTPATAAIAGGVAAALIVVIIIVVVLSVLIWRMKKVIRKL